MSNNKSCCDSIENANSLAGAQKLSDMIQYSPDAIVSRTIIDKPEGTVTLFAFDKEQRLSEHQAPFDALVQVIDGTAGVTIGGEDVAVGTGEMVIMPANIPHAVRAQDKFKMLLTMIKHKEK
jgi:quercetin dioxygenase-like cupin family protein